MTHYNDEYTGIRYRYGSHFRPHFTLYWSFWVIWSDKPHPQFAHGTMDSTEWIEPERAKHWGLELVETINEKQKQAAKMEVA